VETPVGVQVRARVFQFTDVFIAAAMLLTAARISSGSQRGEGILGSGVSVPALAILAVTFLTLFVVWMNHLRWVGAVPRLSVWCVALNSLALFWIALLPFATARVAADLNDVAAVSAYALVLAAMAASLTALRVYAAILHRGDPAATKLHSMMTYKAVAATLIYLGALPLAGVNTYAALACCLFVPIMFFIGDQVWLD
jgi:uncharacterized membrane protein